MRSIQRIWALRVDGYEDYARRLRSPQVRAKLAEAISAGSQAARVTSRYFCLHGEDFVSQTEAGKLYRLRYPSQICAYIHGTLAYLGVYSGVASASCLFYAARIATRVECYHQKRAADARAAARLRSLGLDTEPRVAPRLWSLLAEIRRAHADGRFDTLDARTRSIIEYRWGLTGPGTTLQEIGDLLGLTRERVRQIEARGLARMGIYRARRPSTSPRSVEAPP